MMMMMKPCSLFILEYICIDFLFIHVLQNSITNNNNNTYNNKIHRGFYMCIEFVQQYFARFSFVANHFYIIKYHFQQILYVVWNDEESNNIRNKKRLFKNIRTCISWWYNSLSAFYFSNNKYNMKWRKRIMCNFKMYHRNRDKGSPSC